MISLVALSLALEIEKSCFDRLLYYPSLLVVTVLVQLSPSDAENIFLTTFGEKYVINNGKHKPI